MKWGKINNLHAMCKSVYRARRQLISFRRRRFIRLDICEMDDIYSVNMHILIQWWNCGDFRTMTTCIIRICLSLCPIVRLIMRSQWITISVYILLACFALSYSFYSVVNCLNKLLVDDCQEWLIEVKWFSTMFACIYLLICFFFISIHTTGPLSTADSFPDDEDNAIIDVEEDYKIPIANIAASIVEATPRRGNAGNDGNGGNITRRGNSKSSSTSSLAAPVSPNGSSDEERLSPDSVQVKVSLTFFLNILLCLYIVSCYLYSFAICF